MTIKGEAALLDRVRRQCRLLMILDAAEVASITPISAKRVHAFAYLSDVLSPVWGLPVFKGSILKTVGGPFYRDLQQELDRLVILGLLEIHDLKYVDRPRGARLDGNYALRFESDHLEPILTALGARGPALALDPQSVREHAFLVELANAFARLPNDEVERAAMADVTYASGAGLEDLLDFKAEGIDSLGNPSVRTADRFENFVPEGMSLSPGEKVYLYAAYLGRQLHG